MKRKILKCSTRFGLTAVLFSVFVLVCFTGAQEAWAHATGVSGYSGNPAPANGGGAICTNCHYGGTVPTVTLTGPTTLAPSASGVYTVTITGGAASVGGFDASTTAGTLQASDSATYLTTSSTFGIVAGEVTQSAATSFTSGSLSFTFTLVAPSTTGSLTLYAAGLSANGANGDGGDNAAKTSLTVNVAVPTAPHIVVTDSVAPATDLQIPFGSVTNGLTSDQTVTVSNSGNADLVIGTIASANPLAAPFSITANTCSGQTLAPAAACAMTVRFAPASAGTFNDSFNIPSDDPNTATVTISVSGTGSAIPVPHIIVTDSVAPNNDLSVPFGNVRDGNTSDQTVTVTNSGNANLVIGNIANANPLAAPFSITAGNCSGKTIAPAGTCTVTVRFAPTSGDSFNDSFDIPSNDSGTPSVTVSVSGTGAVNNPPTTPTLVSPTDGQTGVGTTVTLSWTKSTDPDNDPVTYHLYYSQDSSFTNCTPVDVALGGTTGIYFAGSGLLFVGFVFARGGRGRKLMLTLMITMLVMTGALFISCSSGGGASTPASTDITHQVSGLNSATKYYWKVVADDGQGGLTSSATWSFTTQ